MALDSRTTLSPHPNMRKRIIGVPRGRRRHPIYLGVTARGNRTYLLLPNDRSFLVKILLEGVSTSGKTITCKNIIEGLFREWQRYGSAWRHPVFIYDWKGNYMGWTEPNRRKRDRFLLQQIHGLNLSLSLPSDCLHTYSPAYIAPINKREILRKLKASYQIHDLWGIPWRRIMDLTYLGAVLKVPSESMWAQELQPTFDKAVIKPEMTLKQLIGAGGTLEKVAAKIGNRMTRNAALNFVKRWRKNRYWFRDTDRLMQHLTDPFSINTLTFIATATKTYYNQLAFLVSLESLMTALQNSPIVAQPVIVIHDILNLIGEGKPFRNEIVDTLTRFMAGQSRTMNHGYIIILETQNLKAMPKALNVEKDYTIVLKFKWKSQSPLLRRVPGFIGGCADIHNNFYSFHRKSVIIRPPFSSYET